MKKFIYKGAGLALAGSMLMSTVPVLAESNQVLVGLHQKIGQGKNDLEFKLQGMGEAIVALELGIVADDIKAVQKVVWKVSGKTCETYQMTHLEDGREKLVLYIVAENKETPFLTDGSLQVQLTVNSEDKLTFDEEDFYIKVIEKGYKTELYQNMPVSYTEEMEAAQPEVPDSPEEPEQKPEEDNSGGGSNGEGSSSDVEDDDSSSGSSTGSDADKDSSNDAVTEESGQEPETESSISFTDIEKHWAKDAIMEMAEKGIIKGYEDGSFKPGASITRGEFATLLARAFELEAENNSIPFSDVQTGKWYTEGIAALYEVGITSGRADGTFGVNSPITNEEICTMIYRLLQALEIEVANQHHESVKFSDSSKISSYAREAVQALYQKGIIFGNTDGSFGPKSATTRAQVAVMLSRIFKLIK